MASSWVIRQTGSMGKGIYANQQIQQGKIILQEDTDKFITYDKLFEYLEYQEAERQDLLGRMDKTALFAFFLTAKSVQLENTDSELSQSQKQQNTRVKQYIYNLPQKFHSLICWTRAELKVLQNNQLQQKILMKKHDALVDFHHFWILIWHYLSKKQIVGIRLVKDYSALWRINSKLFIHFYAAIESRVVYYLSNQDHNSSVGALAPHIQMFNHSHQPNCKVSIGGARYSVVTIKTINAGEQLFVSYSNLIDDHALQKYGFILDQGPIQETNSSYRQKVAQMYRQRQKNRKDKKTALSLAGEKFQNKSIYPYSRQVQNGKILVINDRSILNNYQDAKF